MQKLTPTEEEVMMHLWQLGRCTVSDILKKYANESPPHSTISSVVRILEKKGFVGHKAYGRTYEYFPIIQKKEYSKRYLDKVVGDYFQGSASNLVSFLVRQRKIGKEELRDLLNTLENE